MASKKPIKNDFSKVTFFETNSGIPLKEAYKPEDLKGDYKKHLNDPGKFPFTRGIHPDMYRGRLWTLRQFAGFGTAEDTNKRFKKLLGEGGGGLSVAFDYPTLYGYDSNQWPGEIGKDGVAISSLKDMEILFKGINLSKISTSMTINAPAAIIWGFYIAAALKQGAKMHELRGTLQNDIMKEYQAQKEWIFPVKAGVKLVVDTIEFASKNLPKWHPVSISGYHIREAGANAVQEVAFTLANGLTYVDECLKRGMKINDFAHRLSFFFNSTDDFFEEVAKFRAARRIWSREMEKRGANEASMKLKFHTQTSGHSLTENQPENNVVRVSLQALAAVLGGTQSLHTDSKDEVYALPTEEAVNTALRTQQVIAYESGAARVADPLGGSYYVEWLTDKVEENVVKIMKEIEKMGGMITATEKGWVQKQIRCSAFEYERKMGKGLIKKIGVNCFVEKGNVKLPTTVISSKVVKIQLDRLKKLEKERDAKSVKEKLVKLESDARDDKNVMHAILEATKEYATLNEIVKALVKVYGKYKGTE